MTLAGIFMLQRSAKAQDEEMSPLPGAKLYFADKPFTTSNEGSKTSFSSNEFIYGRLELEDKTIWDAFQMQALTTKHLFLRCWVMVYKEGKERSPWQSWQYMFIKRGSEKNKWLNFDLMPEPAKATTAMAAGFDFEPSVAAGPLYQQINPEEFPENGKYIIKVKLFLETYNVWGNQNPVIQWPCAVGEFSFTFTDKDVTSILKNYEAASERVKLLIKK